MVIRFLPGIMSLQDWFRKYYHGYADMESLREITIADFQRRIEQEEMRPSRIQQLKTWIGSFFAAWKLVGSEVMKVANIRDNSVQGASFSSCIFLWNNFLNDLLQLKILQPVLRIQFNLDPNYLPILPRILEIHSRTRCWCSFRWQKGQARLLQH